MTKDEPQPISFENLSRPDRLKTQLADAYAKIPKRVGRLLNPVDHHALVFGNTSPLTSVIFENDLHAIKGTNDARAIIKLNKNNPKFAENWTNEHTERGYELLLATAHTSFLPTMSNNSSIDNLFKGILISTELKGHASHEYVKDPLALLNYVLRQELYKQMPDDSGMSKDVYINDDKVSLFAAAVSFVQTTLVDAMKQTDNPNLARRRALRELVLNYSFNVLAIEGHPGMLEYISALKTTQFEPHETKTKRNKKQK